MFRSPFTAFGPRVETDDEDGTDSNHDLAFKGTAACRGDRERRADVPSVRYLPKVLLQVAASIRRAWGRRIVRPPAIATELSARHGGRGQQQDRVLASAVPLRRRPDRGLSKALSSGDDRTLDGPPHSDA